MTRQATTSGPRLDGSQARRAPLPLHPRFLFSAAALSIGVHLAAALLIVYLPRVLPRESRADEQGTVELLMVEAKGVHPRQIVPPPESPSQETPQTPQPKQIPEASKPEAQQPSLPAAASPPAPPPTETGDEAVPPPAHHTSSLQANADAKTDPQQPPPQPAPPRPPQALAFDLAGTDSESYAEALGGRILPASPDNRFRNRMPAYPDDAAILGEHGSVLLMIHVSQAGLATGVDVVQSSGVESLDRAASAAVQTWRFHPALREGRAVSFDMPFRFAFEAD